MKSALDNAKVPDQKGEIFATGYTCYCLHWNDVTVLLDGDVDSAGTEDECSIPQGIPTSSQESFSHSC